MTFLGLDLQEWVNVIASTALAVFTVLLYCANRTSAIAARETAQLNRETAELNKSIREERQQLNEREVIALSYYVGRIIYERASDLHDAIKGTDAKETTRNLDKIDESDLDIISGIEPETLARCFTIEEIMIIHKAKIIVRDYLSKYYTRGYYGDEIGLLVTYMGGPYMVLEEVQKICHEKIGL